MVTFKDIVERWRALPRHQSTGRPIRKSLAMNEFTRWLTSAEERALFKACHAWTQGQASPDCHDAIAEIFESLYPFQRNMAQAHLECARLSGCARSESFLSEIRLIARRRELLEPFLIELVNEIRCGQPRPTIAPPVCVAFPLVWEGKKTAVLGRFNLVIVAGDDRFPAARGDVFPAPAQSLILEMNEDFRNTFLTAATVRNHFQVDGDKQISLPDVRVSIELFVADPVPATISLTGKSGGAALAMGVAKCWASLEQFQPKHSALKKLSLNTIAITAELREDGSLNAVGDIHIKALLTREAEALEVNVLVVAENQTGLPVDPIESNSKSLLLPCGDWRPESFTRREELRSQKSLAVFRPDNLFDVGPMLRRSQAYMLLKVLEEPYFIGAYLVAGNNVFYIALLSLLVSGWYLLPGWWFLLVTFLLLVAGILVVRYRIQKIKRGAGFYLLPQTAKYSPANWSQMVATLEPDQSSRFTCISWFKSLLEEASQERLTLKALPWIWLQDERFWIRLAVPVVLLLLFCTPLQHFVAEQVYPGTADILTGESRRGEGNNAKYASFDSNCESGMCLSEATIGSYGLLRLQVQPKPRTARFLQVKTTSSNTYVKVDDNAPQQREIIVPIVNDEARFYYGINDNSPWEIVLDLEVLSYCGQVLQKGRLVGYRASPGE